MPIQWSSRKSRPRRGKTVERKGESTARLPKRIHEHQNTAAMFCLLGAPLSSSLGRNKLLKTRYLWLPDSGTESRLSEALRRVCAGGFYGSRLVLAIEHPKPTSRGVWPCMGVHGTCSSHAEFLRFIQLAVVRMGSLLRLQLIGPRCVIPRILLESASTRLERPCLTAEVKP